jgi:NAD(P)H dehydrogenase (quinone)
MQSIHCFKSSNKDFPIKGYFQINRKPKVQSIPKPDREKTVILVTGANGQLGRRIVQHLIARPPASVAGRLAVSVRDPGKAADLAARGVEVRHGDFDHPETLASTFAGVERLVLVSTDGPRAQRISQHRNAVNAAAEAGVRHVYYTSFLDVAADSPSEFAAVHRDTEAALVDSGLAHTLLRLPLYAEGLAMIAWLALETGVLYLPAGSGAVSLVSRDDLAQAIAAAALAPRLDKRVYELTGQVAADYASITARIARASGRPLAYKAVQETDYVAALVEHGVPAWRASALGKLFSAVAEGRLATTGTDFAALVGHPPKSLDCLIHEHFAPRSKA